MKTLFNNLSEKLKMQAINKIVAFNNGINLPIFVTCKKDIEIAVQNGYNIDKHFKFNAIGNEVTFLLHKKVKTLEMQIEEIAE